MVIGGVAQWNELIKCIPLKKRGEYGRESKVAQGLGPPGNKDLRILSGIRIEAMQGKP